MKTVTLRWLSVTFHDKGPNTYIGSKNLFFFRLSQESFDISRTFMNIKWTQLNFCWNGFLGRCDNSCNRSQETSEGNSLISRHPLPTETRWADRHQNTYYRYIFYLLSLPMQAERSDKGASNMSPSLNLTWPDLSSPFLKLLSQRRKRHQAQRPFVYVWLKCLVPCSVWLSNKKLNTWGRKVAVKSVIIC